MILASNVTATLGILIPLLIVFGIFIVRPIVQRGQPQPWEYLTRTKEVTDTQQRILAELEAIRARLDAIEHVLTTVD